RFTEEVNRLRRDRYVAAEDELAHVLEPRPGDLLPFLRDDEDVAALPDARTLLLDVERQRIVPCGIQAPDGFVPCLGWVRGDLAQRECLVRQADPGQGAAVAFRAVLERVGEDRGPRCPACLVDEPQRERL